MTSCRDTLNLSTHKIRLSRAWGKSFVRKGISRDFEVASSGNETFFDL
jgi:hypothetical protein